MVGTENDDDGFGDVEEDEDGTDEALKSSFVEKKKSKTVNMNTEEAKRRKLNVLNALPKEKSIVCITDYAYDVDNELWCEIELTFPVDKSNMDLSNVFRKAASKAVIHHVRGIKRAIIIDENGGSLFTEGNNVKALYDLDRGWLDLNRVRCNNVHEMAKYYGVESANRTIVNEIVNVFKVYGITVSQRHLTLIADYMTFDGTYRPFNRIGISHNPSPLQQMTFETAIGFLRAATLAGKTDTLDSPSSCIVMGRPWLGGSNAFKVMQDLKAEPVMKDYIEEGIFAIDDDDED